MLAGLSQAQYYPGHLSERCIPCGHQSDHSGDLAVEVREVASEHCPLNQPLCSCGIDPARFRVAGHSVLRSVRRYRLRRDPLQPGG